MVRLMWLLRPLDRSAAVEDWAAEISPAANALAAGRWHQICRLLARSRFRLHLLCCSVYICYAASAVHVL